MAALLELAILLVGRAGVGAGGREEEAKTGKWSLMEHWTSMSVSVQASACEVWSQMGSAT